MDLPPTISPEGVDQALLLWMQELSPHGICVTDAALRIQTWNLWFEYASRLRREDVLGRHLFEVFPELTKRHMERYFDRALAGEVIVLSAAFHRFLFSLPSPIPEFGHGNMLQTSRIAPLIRQGEIVGTITTVEDVTQREYQNALLRRQHDRQELFTWALAHLLESPNPESIVKEIFPRISAHIEVDVYFNYLIDTEGKQLRLHSSGGCPVTAKQERAILALSASVCGPVASPRQSLILSDLQQSTDSRTEVLRNLGVRSYICHPLVSGKKWIGTLSFGSCSRVRFAADEIDFTQILAQYVAVAIDRSRRVEELFATQRELSSHEGSV